ncbi:Mitochondrial rho gtpase [Thalictrum thalictroides]|uniref:Mitochondrial rho gtpase n=1 Tax=Thalictrum thalictroides TaxID=46969 RepID=A0A7J6VFH1_THATH|nr:Mitochondrial rho gtpase [Thalictrum thalictroides]
MKLCDLATIKQYIQTIITDGVENNGLTLWGFYVLNAILIIKGHLQNVWVILCYFGYDENLILRTNRISVAVEQPDEEDLELFNFALCAILNPPSQLYYLDSFNLKPRCVSALKSIFIRSDHDKDGALSDAEWNAVQEECFGEPLLPSEIAGYKALVRKQEPEGVNDNGLTLAGYLKLHELILVDCRLEYTWKVLRNYGYDNKLRFRDDYIPVSFKREPDQTVELTNEAVDFLKGIFCSFDADADGVLQYSELGDLFSAAPESPWNAVPYKDSAEDTALGGLCLDGFLSKWSLMTLLEPAKSLANLIYIGYPGEFTSAMRITRQRQVDCKKQQSERNVFQCFVFGPRKAGKSALLNSFLGRQFSESYVSTPTERFAANVVVKTDGIKKTLILREIPEDKVQLLMSNKESLAACDVAIFVHDSSDPTYWKVAEKMLFDVAHHGENGGCKVPCLVVAAKDDIRCQYAMEAGDPVGDPILLGIEAPIRISTKVGDVSDVFQRIVYAAEHPHLSIPETEAENSRKQYTRSFKQSLMFVSAAVAVGVGIRAYSRYAASENSSS